MYFITYKYFAERQGFEPRVPRGTTVFKTAAIDHSATSPNAGANIKENLNTQKKEFIFSQKYPPTNTI